MTFNTIKNENTDMHLNFQIFLLPTYFHPIATQYPRYDGGRECCAAPSWDRRALDRRKEIFARCWKGRCCDNKTVRKYNNRTYIHKKKNYLSVNVVRVEIMGEYLVVSFVYCVRGYVNYRVGYVVRISNRCYHFNDNESIEEGK